MIVKRNAYLDENGRIWGTAIPEYDDDPDLGVFIEFPDDFDFLIQHEYRYVDGRLIHDPFPDPPETRIAKLKQQLADTDYVVVKMSESSVTRVPLNEEDSSRYADIIEQRRQWREEINKLESEVNLCQVTP